MADPARLKTLEASLVLVRHGQTTWITEGRFQGSSDPPLSDVGRRQAAAVGARLANPEALPALPLPPGAPLGIWHSPLSRAADTAAAIAAARTHHVPRHATPGLLELAQGEWEGLTQQQVLTRYPAELAAWRTDPTRHQAPGGETIAAASARVASAVAGILEALIEAQRSRPAAPPGVPDEGGSRVLGYEPAPGEVPRPWALVVAHDGILRLVLTQLLELPVERYWAFPFGLCNLTVVEMQHGGGRLRAHNLDEHLERPAT